MKRTRATGTRPGLPVSFSLTFTKGLRCARHCANRFPYKIHSILAAAFAVSLLVNTFPPGHKAREQWRHDPHQVVLIPKTHTPPTRPCSVVQGCPTRGHRAQGACGGPTAPPGRAASAWKPAFLSVSQRLQMAGGRTGGALLTSDPV